MVQVSVMLEKAGVDAIEISGGTIAALLTGDIDNSFSPATRPRFIQGSRKKLKEKIKIPLILVGGIRSFETADELVKTGTTDYISLCRPLIREPDLIKRWKSEISENQNVYRTMHASSLEWKEKECIVCM